VGLGLGEGEGEGVGLGVGVEAKKSLIGMAPESLFVSGARPHEASTVLSSE